DAAADPWGAGPGGGQARGVPRRGPGLRPAGRERQGHGRPQEGPAPAGDGRPQPDRRPVRAALAVMALVSIGLGWLVAGRVLRPPAPLPAPARRLEGSTLHERLHFQGPQDELKELADTFDQMLGRLDAAFETQRRFVANASHELRTPLAIARTEVDVALADPATGRAELRAMAERVLEANQRSERLIEGLLTLARSERQLRAAEPGDP